MMKLEDYKENFLVSLIVPVYNVEPYLRRCLSSIISQTYKNLEIIIVDDGSTDNSGLICDEYALSDKRIKVIHKENGGLSSARNVGLGIATGEYIGFVDSDDYIDLSFVEKMMANNNGYDMIMCRFCIEEGSKKYIPMPFDYTDNVLINGYDVFELICREKVDCSCCTKLFKKTFFEQKTFPIGKTNEDFVFLSNVLLDVDSALYIKDVTYYYIKRNDSITTKPFSKSQFDKVYNSYDCIDVVREKKPQLLKASIAYHIKQCFYIYKKLVIDTELKLKYFNDYIFIRSCLKKNSFRLLMSKYFKFKEKISILYSVLFPIIYCKLHNK